MKKCLKNLKGLSIYHVIMIRAKIGGSPRHLTWPKFGNFQNPMYPSKQFVGASRQIVQRCCLIAQLMCRKYSSVTPSSSLFSFRDDHFFYFLLSTDSSYFYPSNLQYSLYFLPTITDIVPYIFRPVLVIYIFTVVLNANWV